jgi:hypothetical protein
MRTTLVKRTAEANTLKELVFITTTTDEPTVDFTAAACGTLLAVVRLLPEAREIFHAQIRLSRRNLSNYGRKPLPKQADSYGIARLIHPRLPPMSPQGRGARRG